MSCGWRGASAWLILLVSEIGNQLLADLLVYQARPFSRTALAFLALLIEPSATAPGCLVAIAGELGISGALDAGDHLVEFSEGQFFGGVPAPSVEIGVAGLASIEDRMDSEASIFFVKIGRVCAEVDWVLKGGAFECFHGGVLC